MNCLFLLELEGLDLAFWAEEQTIYAMEMNILKRLKKQQI
jgi:hypothetical protein